MLIDVVVARRETHKVFSVWAIVVSSAIGFSLMGLLGVLVYFQLSEGKDELMHAS